MASCLFTGEKVIDMRMAMNGDGEAEILKADLGAKLRILF